MADLKKVGVILTAEGKGEFVRDLKDVNAELRENYSALKLQEEQFGKNTSKQEKMAKLAPLYAKDLQLQSDKVKTLRSQLEELEGAEVKNERAITNKRRELNYAEKDLGKYEKKVQDVEKKLKDGTYAWENFAEKLGKAGDKTVDVGKKVSVMSGAVAGLGTMAIASAISVDDAYKEMIKSTGAVGAEADELKESMRNVFRDVPESADEVADAMGSLNTITGLTGDKLETITEQTLSYARVNNKDAGESAKLLGRLMVGLGQDMDDLPIVMDKLTYAAQNSGIEVDTLSGLLIDAGPAFEEMGFGLDESIALFSSFTAAGADPREIVSSLNIAMTRMAKEGITDAEEAFGMMIKEIEDAPTIIEATALSAELFGAKTGGKIADDIQAGRFNIEEWTEAVKNSGGTLDATAENTVTFGDRLNMLKNKGTDLMNDFGGPFVTALENMMEAIKPMIERVATLADKFSNLDEGTQQTIVKIVAFAAILGPAIIIVGKMMTAISSIISVLSLLAGAIGIALGPLLAIVAGIAAVVAAGALLVSHLKKDAIPEVNLFGDEVSESTAQAVGAFTDMTEEANVQLKELAWGQSEVTAEMAEDMKSKQGEITDTLLTSIDERNETERARLIEQLDKVGTMTQESKDEALAKLDAHYEEEKNKTEIGNQQINDIIDLAAKEGRAIREDEAKKIELIREGMTTTAVKTMSQSEAEQKTILEKMRTNSGTITALEAADVVKNATEKKDAVIAEADAQLDETIAVAIMQRDELGTLTAEQADAMIKEAQEQRDGVVDAANKTHDDVIRAAKDQAGEHVNQIDWETGEVLSKWQAFKGNVGRKWDDIKNAASEKWEAIKEGIVAPIEDAKKKISDIIDRIKGFFTNLKLSFPKISMPKMPKFSLTGKFSLVPPSVPKVGITWNADGGIFRRPTIFDTVQGAQGVGEAGAEAIIPLNEKTLGGIGAGILNSTKTGQSENDVNELVFAFKNMLQNMEFEIQDGGDSFKAIIDDRMFEVM